MEFTGLVEDDEGRAHRGCGSIEANGGLFQFLRRGLGLGLGLGYRVQDSGFRVQGSGFRVSSLGFTVETFEFRVLVSGLK